MSEFGCKDPRGFFISACIACPSDKVEEFAGMVSVVNLGVENLGDFEFRFIINKDGWWWRLNLFGDWVQEGWFQHGEMEYRVYSAETVQKCQRVWNGYQAMQ